MGTTFYIEDWFSHQHLKKLEKLIAPGYSCAFDSVQNAVQAACELLGARIDMVPVILPVTAPPDTLAAVLRAGCHPLLLDIEEDTLQMNPSQLKEVIDLLEEEEKVPIVLFTRPAGLPINPALLRMVEDLPSIADTRLLPHPELVGEDVPCSFNIFDLTPICGSGAVVVHAFEDNLPHLKEVRNGPMGLNAMLPEQQAKHAYAVLGCFGIELDMYKDVSTHFAKHLPVLGPSRWPAPVWVRVDNARSVATHLASYDIQAKIGLYPLYKLEEVRIRYAENPDYPVAESLENSFLCIPTHQNVQGKEEDIVTRIKEVL